MKRKLTFVAIASALLITSACKKDETTPSTNSTGGGTVIATTTPTFTGKVNNVAKSSTSISGTFNGTSFAVNGAGMNFEWGMYVNDNAQVGQNYDLATSSMLLVSYSDNVGSVDYLSETGTAKITKKDTVNKILEVTFSGTFEDFNSVAAPITVTNGVMKTYYTE